MASPYGRLHPIHSSFYAEREELELVLWTHETRSTKACDDALFRIRWRTLSTRAFIFAEAVTDVAALDHVQGSVTDRLAERRLK